MLSTRCIQMRYVHTRALVSPIFHSFPLFQFLSVLTLPFFQQKTIKFTLDKSKPNLVMRQADGFWHVQTPADRYLHERYQYDMISGIDERILFIVK